MSKPIETKRLYLYPFSEGLLTENYVSWLNDAEVVKYSEQRHKKHTIQSCREYFQTLESSSHYLWAVTEKNAEKEHIGNINAYIDDKNSIAEVGILIGCKMAWGKGYGLEAWNAVCEFLFQKGIRKIIAGTVATNKGMLCIMKKSGMKTEGIRKNQYVIDGMEVDMILVAKFNPTFYPET